MDTQDLRYRLALSMLRSLNPKNARLLLEKTGSVQAVFDIECLKEIPKVNQSLLDEIEMGAALRQADKECAFIEKTAVDVYWFEEAAYPERLKACSDAPLLLYGMGKTDLNTSKILSVVGTRKMTAYGRNFIEKLIAELADAYPELLIVSGLAYGVDICAHRTALKHHLDTVAVLAHGLDHVYPAMHRATAKQIYHQGALLSENPSRTPPEGWRFVQRNRIVAGLCDACLVVESARKGGSLITARMARDYNRDVLALPGRYSDAISSGCNALIKTQVAALVESAEDVVRELAWDSRPIKKEMPLFPDLEPEYQSIYALFDEGEQYSVSELLLRCHTSLKTKNYTVPEILSLLSYLEMIGVLESLPGGLYRKRM